MPQVCPLCCGKGSLDEPKNRTKFIREVSMEFQIPQFLLVCPEHHRWLTELDPHFPYEWILNRCDRCQ